MNHEPTAIARKQVLKPEVEVEVEVVSPPIGGTWTGIVSVTDRPRRHQTVLWGDYHEAGTVVRRLSLNMREAHRFFRGGISDRSDQPGVDPTIPIRKCVYTVALCFDSGVEGF
jgi:hypothetical protein